MRSDGDQDENRRASEEAGDRRGWITAAEVAGLTSLGAGAIHAAAIGIHAEHATLARLFVAVAAAQLGAGLVMLLKGGRAASAATLVINAGAVVAWVVTRVSGISWIEGLEHSEAPQFADTACAALGAVAAVAAGVALVRGRTERAGSRVGLPAVAVGALTVVAMMYGGTHVHSHDESAGGHTHSDGAAAASDDDTHTDDGAAADGHTHSDDATAASDNHAHTDDAAAASDDHAPTDDAAAAATDGHSHSGGGASGTAAAWPRAWDPSQPIDFSGVPGVTRQQQARAERLTARTLAVLPAKFSDVRTLNELGFDSIGDGRTGYEHYINIGYLADDHFLDPNYPESLVYAVDGQNRTLVSAMYIAGQTPIDDPELVDFAGPLMQWHVHQNLCWALNDEGVPEVVALTDDHGGTCPAGTIHAGGDNPMVHVWVVPHECGPFAALEGHGAGQADAATGQRVDVCVAGHGHGEVTHPASATVPYDPRRPIDLSGVPGVTPRQQAFAENLVATNVVRLPQWSDPAVAEAAGFRSIGDGGTGHEHYIQWDWIEDDVWLDPDAPESLVYEPQPDGSKKLVSAMYMLPSDMTLDEVPNYGGTLMQWHIHNDLCFTDDPEAPQVAGLREPNGTCPPPLVELRQSPMIHVWITPHPCGPFAALEGVGAGAIKQGEERWCDHAHGA